MRNPRRSRLNPLRYLGPGRTPQSTRECPGAVEAILGVAFQSDASSWLGRWIIRPAEMLDQWWGGVARLAAPPGTEHRPPLAMHAGVHVRLADGREYILEQLASDWEDLGHNGLHWTPLAAFAEREARREGGWNETVSLSQFRQLGPEVEAEARQRAASIKGRPFLAEDCTGLVGRIFGDRRVFADSPVLSSLGIPMRSGEPALPSLRRDAKLSAAAERRLRGPALRALPNPTADAGTLSVRQAHHHGWLVALALAAAALIYAGLHGGAAGKSRR